MTTWLVLLISLGLPETPAGPSLAPLQAFSGQYHRAAAAVSYSPISAVSANERAPDSEPNLANKGVQTDQYHAAEKRREMLGIAFGLALVYVAFLGAWFWATRWRRVDSTRRTE